MADLISQLYGSCACERNQYTIVIPTESASLAQVFFDNSRANRRAQAAPVTAWLRVPLDWYQSATVAHYPDESHSSIKRIFYPTSRSNLPQSIRRHFCGYCGTTLSSFDESLRTLRTTTTSDPEDDYLDITLGSLDDPSLELLETLQLITDSDSDTTSSNLPSDAYDDNANATPQDDPTLERAAEEIVTSEGLIKGGMINDETHIPTSSPPPPALPVQARSSRPRDLHRMTSRGIPWFEEMVEHSRLGRIKRRRGGEVSGDGRTRVSWEVVEVDGLDDGVDDEVGGGEGGEEEGMEVEIDGGRGKKRRLA